MCHSVRSKRLFSFHSLRLRVAGHSKIEAWCPRQMWKQLYGSERPCRFRPLTVTRTNDVTGKRVLQDAAAGWRVSKVVCNMKCFLSMYFYFYMTNVFVFL